jgi:hypothetical protein
MAGNESKYLSLTPPCPLLVVRNGEIFSDLIVAVSNFVCRDLRNLSLCD